MFSFVTILLLTTSVAALCFRSGFRYAARFFTRHPEILDLYQMQSGHGPTDH